MVNSELVYNIVLTDQDVEYTKNDGSTGSFSMIYDKYPDWADENGTVSINGTENEQTGYSDISIKNYTLYHTGRIVKSSCMK